MTPPLRSKVALAAVALGFAQDEFFAADALADAALNALADFSQKAKLWQKPDLNKLAELNALAFEAEQRRTHTRWKMLWEFCEAVRTADAQD